jgi:NAD(P)H-hydrate epimerase
MTVPAMPVRVTTAAQAAARDAAAIAAGIDGYALMHRAGTAAAHAILAHVADVRTAGAVVYCGGGNNGGDGWVVAAELARNGCPVQVVEALPATTDDARRACAEAREVLAQASEPSQPAVVIDALLGTGATGPLREPLHPHVRAIAASRATGATVVALDLPSGVDATTGAGGETVRADITLAFGSLKRGHLLRRDECGAIVCLDIGLGAHAALDDGAPLLVDVAFVRGAIPPIPADAHKGVRRRLGIVGGGEGMAGAPMLAARGAMRSGIGMVQLLVAPTNVPVVQAALPETMAGRWPVTAEDQDRVLHWTHCLLLGPGLGRTAMTRALVERLLVEWKGPVVLDADALNVFEGEPRMLGSLLGARPAIVTPHPVETGRLLRRDGASVSAERFTVGVELAKQLGATVVLKGVPTVISAPDGRVAVSAAGSPALGTAGSGDVLAGIVATLLAQTGDPFAAACAATWVHGRAGEIAAERGSVRGTSLEDVVEALRYAWRLDEPTRHAAVLTTLPAVGSAR